MTLRSTNALNRWTPRSTTTDKHVIWQLNDLITHLLMCRQGHARMHTNTFNKHEGHLFLNAAQEEATVRAHTLLSYLDVGVH